MFLELAHTRMPVFLTAKKLLIECYKVTQLLPAEEKFNLVQQIRRAALSVYLNIAEGSSRTSETERKRFYEIARSSVVEVDTALDFCELQYHCRKEDMKRLGDELISCFRQLSGLIGASKKEN